MGKSISSSQTCARDFRRSRRTVNRAVQASAAFDTVGSAVLRGPSRGSDPCVTCTLNLRNTHMEDGLYRNEELGAAKQEPIEPGAAQKPRSSLSLQRRRSGRLTRHTSTDLRKWFSPMDRRAYVWRSVESLLLRTGIPSIAARFVGRKPRLSSS